MRPVPTRLALAGSVLLLGSVGTMSAVRLESSTVAPEEVTGSPAALSPPPTRQPTAGPPSVTSPQRAASKTAPAPARAGRPAVRRPTPHAPARTKELIDIAAGSDARDTVVVPLRDLARTLSLRRARGQHRSDLGSVLAEMDGVVDAALRRSSSPARALVRQHGAHRFRDAHRVHEVHRVRDTRHAGAHRLREAHQVRDARRHVGVHRVREAHRMHDAARVEYGRHRGTG